MPQVIYTGQGREAPKTQGYAMQALSQYGQQSQARKTHELETNRKDRDTFAEMLKIDPVYASSKAAQDRVAGIMDNFLDKMALFNKDQKGPLSASDLTKMQQERALAMTQMNYIKGANDKIVQAADMIAKNPGRFNERMFSEAYDKWINEGILPDGPVLIPAFEDPTARWQKSTQILRQGAAYKQAGVPAIRDDGMVSTQYERRYPNEVGMPEAMVEQKFLSDPQERRHILGFFGEKYYNDPETFNAYMKKADGNESLAATLWFKENKSPAYPQDKYTDTRLRSANQAGGMLNLANGSLWDGKYQIFSTQNNIPVVDGKLDTAIVFNAQQSKKNPVSLPTNVLILPEGVETKGSTVQASVHAADANKTYWVIGKESLDKVWFTEKAIEAMPKDVFVRDPNTNLYRIKEGLEDDVQIPTRTEDTKGLIDAWTGNQFSSQLKSLPKAPEEKIDLMNLE